MTWVVGEFAVRFALLHAPDRILEVRYHRGLPVPEQAHLAQLCEAHGIAWLRDDREVEAKRSKGSAYVLAVLEKQDTALAGDRPQVGIMAPIEPGNLGTALRTALAFGIEDVAVIGEGDAWSPHVQRASLGAACALRIQHVPDLGTFAAAVEAAPWLLHGAANQAISDVHPGADFRVVVGPAWPGFTAEDLALGNPVAIRIDPRVESLNVALALGITLHDWQPQGQIRQPNST